jgi:regulator of replication initiation timing
MIRRALLLLPLLAALCLPAFAGRRDPLTDAEVDQMREIAQQGDKRIRLLVTFAKSRLVAIEQMRGDSKFAEGRGQRVHDLIEDFTTIVDELDKNIDQYANQKQDIRKPLKEVVEADADFQLRLRALQDAAKSDDHEAKEWQFVVQDALDAVKDVGDNARETLNEQEDLAKDKKLHKPS